MGPYGTALSVARILENMALEALVWHWGEAYEITVADGLWTARRRDNWGAPIEAGSPDRLRQEILDDYMMRPVPRPAAAHVPAPVEGSVYSAGPRLAGRAAAADEKEKWRYPLTGVCACGAPLSREFGAEWEHREADG